MGEIKEDNGYKYVISEDRTGLNVYDHRKQSLMGDGLASMLCYLYYTITAAAVSCTSHRIIRMIFRILILASRVQRLRDGGRDPDAINRDVIRGLHTDSLIKDCRWHVAAGAEQI